MVVERASLALVLLPAVVALAVVPPSNDGENDIKMLAIAIAVAIATWPVLRDRAWRGRRILGAPGWAAAAFLAVATVATLTSDRPLLSFVGTADRQNGLLAYGVGVTILAVVGGVFPLERLGQCAKALAAGSALAALYWLGQLAGWDPLGTMPPAGAYSSPGMFSSTLGNPNFAGAFVAASLPPTLWAAVRPHARPIERVLWLAVAAHLLRAVLGADSLQAPLAALAGTGVLAIAVLSGRSRRAAAAALTVGAMVIALTAAGLAQRGPLADLGHQETLVSRTWNWTAAARMARADPWTGVGFSRFVRHVRNHRPDADVAAHGWGTQADAAHSVPLDMASGGGVPLLAAYLLLVGTVGRRLVAGLMRLEGERLLLLGGWGGVWTAYQAQSLVSIDVAQLSFLHFLSAGGILALTAVRRRHDDDGPDAVPRHRLVAARTAFAAVASGVILLLATITAAELLIGVSDSRVSAGNAHGAVQASRWSVRLTPWQPGSWSALGRAFTAAGVPDRALVAHLRALRHDPRDFYQVLMTTDAAREQGDPALVLRMLRTAVALEPQAADMRVLAAKAALELGRRQEAAALVAAALALDATHEEAAQLQAVLAERANGRQNSFFP